MEDKKGKDKSLKRAADSQIPPDDATGERSQEASDSNPQPAKKPALTSSFSFRPSPLHKATQGLFLRQSTLTPPSSSTSSSSSSSSPSAGASSNVSQVAEKPSQLSSSSAVGFLKLDNSELKPITVTSSVAGPPTINGREGVNHEDSKTSGSFSSFMESARTVPTFSSLSSMTGANSTFGRGEDGEQQEECAEEKKEGGEAGGGGGDGGGGEGGSGEVGVGSTGSVPVLLPEVQRVTGEEGENKIVQITARLYAFDAVTHTWKERGRGDVRLNDACQREGLFQSRLVMRASGSYRVLFNTHLWAEMKCERANQKSIRIAAQDGQGITIFLITGNNKDIQQLYSAVDHRIEALKLNAKHSSEESASENEAQARILNKSPTPLDDEDKESVQEDVPSSPESTDASDTTNFREKAVSLPSDQSGCEDGEGGGGGGGGEGPNNNNKDRRTKEVTEGDEEDTAKMKQSSESQLPSMSTIQQPETTSSSH